LTKYSAFLSRKQEKSKTTQWR